MEMKEIEKIYYEKAWKLIPILQAKYPGLSKKRIGKMAQMMVLDAMKIAAHKI